MTLPTLDRHHALALGAGLLMGVLGLYASIQSGCVTSMVPAPVLSEALTPLIPSGSVCTPDLSRIVTCTPGNDTCNLYACQSNGAFALVSSGPLGSLDVPIAPR